MRRLISLVIFAFACGPSAPRALVRTEGAQLTDGEGRPLVLRGVNLGSWMYHETWISNFGFKLHGRIWVEAQRMGIEAQIKNTLMELGPSPQSSDGRAAYLESLSESLRPSLGDDIDTLIAAASDAPDIWDDSDLPLIQALDTRFGPEGRIAVLDAFQRAWITESDIERIADIGLNLVRVPTGWRELVDPTSQEIALEPKALARLDQLFDWCERHQLYAVLDLQDSPGGHNDYAEKGVLYESPQDQERTIELWTALSKHFGHRTIIAAYSLLAEPYAAPSVGSMMDFYKRLHDAIRAQGDAHLMVIHDGFKGIDQLPEPSTLGLDGVIYSTHLFDTDIGSIDGYNFLAALYEDQLQDAQDKTRVPMFVGSFSTAQDTPHAYEATQNYVKLFDRKDWSWALWTYKRVDDPIDATLFGSSTGWGLVRAPKEGWRRPDLKNDSLETLIEKMETYNSKNFTENAALIDALSIR